MLRVRREFMKAFLLRFMAVVLTCGLTLAGAQAQQPTSLTQDQKDQRALTEKELESIAVIDRKVMVPMRDGVHLATDIYRPKNASSPVPIIWVRTPYNFNYWDVANGVPADMNRILTAVKHGYAMVIQNERGHFFSEGNYDILGAPRSDGDDMLKWLSSQSWSSGKVGTTGCSSTAEYQRGIAALGNPAYAAMNVQGFGAGVGRVAPYWEQGNWYRGGAVQMLFIAWIYGEQNQVRPMFPPNTSQEDLIRASKEFDLAQQLPPVDWSKALQHLPEIDIIKAVDGPHGIYADRMEVSTGGAMIKRAPNDPAWYRGGLWDDSHPINIPGLWFMSWYDVSVGPNLAAYNHVRHTADPAVANEQYAVIAPMPHCSYKRATEQTMVGERDLGDARLDYDALTYGWFDHFLKGGDNGLLAKTPKVQYYTMGSNKWQSSDTWPPADAKPVTYYLSSGGRANSLNGDGALLTAPEEKDAADKFVYDPMNPVTTNGGGFCCMGANLKPGAIDQRSMETRDDILVYSTGPLKEGIEVTGSVDVTLYVSSDAKDTDFTVKLIEVMPDGTAYNIDENIQRARYRDGYDKPPVWMEKDKVYKVTFQPMETSDYFAPGHELRIEVSSSNFPRYDRNLNTGGNNYDESTGVIAHNQVHHSAQYPSSITLSMVKR